MRYAFNLWTQGNANPDWLGNLDFNRLENNPVYQFVEYFRYYEYNGSGFNNNPTTDINFSARPDIDDNFFISDWEFGQSQGFLSWSKDAVGIVDLGNGNSAMWLGLFHAGDERGPRASEIPTESGNTNPGGAINIQAESAVGFNGLRIGATGLGFISNGSWASFAPTNISQAGLYRVTYRVSSGGDGGSIQLEQAGGANVFGTVQVPATGSWGNYTTVSHDVNLPAGNLSFGMYFADGGFNFDYFQIVRLQ